MRQLQQRRQRRQRRQQREPAAAACEALIRAQFIIAQPPQLSTDRCCYPLLPTNKQTPGRGHTLPLLRQLPAGPRTTARQHKRSREPQQRLPACRPATPHTAAVACVSLSSMSAFAALGEPRPPNDSALAISARATADPDPRTVNLAIGSYRTEVCVGTGSGWGGCAVQGEGTYCP